MKTSKTTNRINGRRWRVVAGILATVLLISGLTACNTTKQVSETPKDFSGFLGDYTMLKKGDGHDANYIYINESADWSKYTKVYIKNIDLWKSEDKGSPLNKLSPEDQQMLVNFVHTAMANALEKNYQIVDQPGSDTLVIHGAITDYGKSWPVLNLVSTVYPAALVLSFGKQMITGTAAFVGKVRIEGEITDGATGNRIAAFVDERAGTKAFRSKFDGSWGDVKLAFDWWAARLDQRMELFKKGDFSTKGL